MRSISIAITDDFDLARRDMPKMLNYFGVDTVLTAKHGKELLEKLDEGVMPELVLLDIRMPVMDGFATARALRQKWPQIKILAYSMDSIGSVRDAIIEAGAHGFIPKGVAPETLVNAMFNVLNEGCYEYHENS